MSKCFPRCQLSDALGASSSPAASSISGLTEKVLPGHQSRKRIEDQEEDHNEPSY
ncbi:hypothetical protein F2P79_025701 [Pimephales promelas]|nr:hypothetical protein F2P79_025701 [Pimephales promelas]